MLEGDPEALLFVTFFADTPEEASEQLDRLADAWRRHGHGYHTLRAESAAEQDALTKVRKAGLGLLMAASTGARRPAAFVEDTAVAPERLNDYVARFREILDRHGLTAGFYGHCSVGCLHIRPFVDLSQPGDVETMRAVAEEIVELVACSTASTRPSTATGSRAARSTRACSATSSTRRSGRSRRCSIPHGRLNPGVMVDAPPMTEHLRDPALPAARPLKTRLSFAEHGGMRGAADRCQRIGACRKTGIGVMCPSYMATREEEHATRGRANALVKALSAPDPHAALGDERLHEILDLCLECKACKSECPLSVDMASLKSEFLSHYQDIHGVPLRSRLFGAIRPLNRAGAALAPVSNLPARVPAARALLERALGIDAPAPAAALRARAPRALGPAPGARARRRRAATSCSSPTPSRPTPSPRSAARRSSCSKRPAGACAWRAPAAAGGRASPRACSTRRAGWPRTWRRGWRPTPSAACRSSAASPRACSRCARSTSACSPDDPRAEAVARQARLVEELLVEAIDDGALRLDPASPVSGRRSSSTATATRRRSRAPRRRSRCSSASRARASPSWTPAAAGWPARSASRPSTTSLSMQVGESRLFPALRAADAGALVAATGVSCRQQIAHGAGRRARHPVELVRAAL